MGPLPDSTLIYPGHDYLENNLMFTLDREPGNEAAAELVFVASEQDPDDALVTTLGREKEINTFFRLENPEVIEQLRLKFADLATDPDPETVFLRLRELRNEW